MVVMQRDPTAGMICECGGPTINHCRRCEGCQWEAILKIIGWDEEKAERESVGALREIKHRGGMKRRYEKGKR
jgi:hypothetical protein